MPVPLEMLRGREVTMATSWPPTRMATLPLDCVFHSAATAAAMFWAGAAVVAVAAARLVMTAAGGTATTVPWVVGGPPVVGVVDGTATVPKRPGALAGARATTDVVGVVRPTMRSTAAAPTEVARS